MGVTASQMLATATEKGNLVRNGREGGQYEGQSVTSVTIMAVGVTQDVPKCHKVTEDVTR